MRLLVAAPRQWVLGVVGCEAPGQLRGQVNTVYELRQVSQAQEPQVAPMCT
jgi:hypothetical protein